MTDHRRPRRTALQLGRAGPLAAHHTRGPQRPAGTAPAGRKESLRARGLPRQGATVETQFHLVYGTCGWDSTYPAGSAGRARPGIRASAVPRGCSSSPHGVCKPLRRRLSGRLLLKDDVSRIWSEGSDAPSRSSPAPVARVTSFHQHRRVSPGPEGVSRARGHICTTLVTAHSEGCLVASVVPDTPWLCPVHH